MSLLMEESTWARSAPVGAAAKFDASEFDDASSFGMQGFQRGRLQILRPEFIGRFAAALAVAGHPDEIRDPEFARTVLARRQDWLETYRIVHLIERSLWIAGRSDLVMRMTRDPHQIPDNPPPAILDALTRACLQHPEATVWYAEPLFSDQVNSDGLPIPLTAREVELEAARRIEAAQEQAIRWRGIYRAAAGLATVPNALGRAATGTVARVHRARERMVDYWNRARYDAKQRARALIVAQLEKCNCGETSIRVPEHTTRLGRFAEFSFEMLMLLHEFVSRQSDKTVALATTAGVPIVVAGYIPIALKILTVIPLDPFLFIELPDEPGQLRHVGHWYWQKQANGRKKLHLHV